MIERIARQNPFLQRETDGTYRMHELFREFLSETGRHEHASRGRSVRMAATALERAGYRSDALRLLSSSGFTDDVLALLARHGFSLLDEGFRDDVSAAIRALPRQRQDAPVAVAFRGYLLRLDGSLVNAENELRRAIALGLPDGMAAEARFRLAKLLLNRRRVPEGIALLREALAENSVGTSSTTELRATLAAAYAVASEREAALGSLATAADALSTIDAPSRARVLHLIALAHFYLGGLVEAEAAALECAQLAETLGLDQVAGNANSILISVASYLHAEANLETEYAQAVIRLGQNCNDKVLQAHGARAAFIAAADRGDDEARRTAARQLAILGRINDFRDTIPFRHAAALSDAGNGDFQGAILTLASIDTRELTKPELAYRDGLLVLLYFAQGDHDAASKLLGRPFVMSAESDTISRNYQLLAQAYRAFGSWLLGRYRTFRAIDINDDALSHRDRLFIGVMSSICATQPARITDRQIDQLTEPLAAFQLSGRLRFLRQVTSRITRSRETLDLTATQIAVLRAFRGGATIADVANRLGRSRFTVNDHLKAIYSKLGCSSRAAALAYAADAGLLGDD